MTWEQFAEQHLIENGMFESQAKAVVERAMENKDLQPLQGRWNDAIDGYPRPTQVLFVRTLRRIAVEWIEENCPNMWFKEALRD